MKKFVPAAWLAAWAYGLGLGVWAAWPSLQSAVGEVHPLLVALTGRIAEFGIFLSVGLMAAEVLPAVNLWRIGLYFAGVLGFGVNLLAQKNSGNVALEAALTASMAYSVFTNARSHQPSQAAWGKWLSAALALASCYVFGLAVAAIWPVTAETQWAWAGWPYVALAGGLVLFLCVAVLETRAARGTEAGYLTAYGAGCALLTLSYLGEYNRAGLVLNSALCASLFGPVVWRAVRGAS